MTRIKVCGLRRPEDIRAVNEAKPDYCGFIVEFPKSHRSIDRDTLRGLVAELDEGIVPVGVFVNAPIELPASLADEGSIRMIQLHGSEDEAYIAELRGELVKRGDRGTEIIKAFSVKTEDDLRLAEASSADHVLLDQGDGGTGKTFDWSLMRGFARPFFLAGGLGSDNLAEAIEKLSPWAVDLSSSLEVGGFKDRSKIMQAVNITRECSRKAMKHMKDNEEE